jgi:hypothetical protein
MGEEKKQEGCQRLPDMWIEITYDLDNASRCRIRTNMGSVRGRWDVMESWLKFWHFKVDPAHHKGRQNDETKRVYRVMLTMKDEESGRWIYYESDAESPYLTQGIVGRVFDHPELFEVEYLPESAAPAVP